MKADQDDRRLRAEAGHRVVRPRDRRGVHVQPLHVCEEAIQLDGVGEAIRHRFPPAHERRARGLPIEGIVELDRVEMFRRGPARLR